MPAADCLLRLLGVSGKLSGFYYAVYMLEQVQQKPDHVLLITKRLYKQTAQHFETISGCVERNLRTLVRACWRQPDHTLLDQIAGMPLRKPPTNMQFLDMLSALQNRTKETACVSPVSLLLSLAAVASASEGGTKDEFAKILGNSANDPQRLLHDMHEICKVLNDCSAVRELTNTITGALDHVFQPDFMENMRRTFGDGVGMKNWDIRRTISTRA